MGKNKNSLKEKIEKYRQLKHKICFQLSTLLQCNHIVLILIKAIDNNHKITRDVPEVFPAPAPAGKRAFLVLRLRPENGYFVAGKN